MTSFLKVGQLMKIEILIEPGEAFSLQSLQIKDNKQNIPNTIMLIVSIRHECNIFS